MSGLGRGWPSVLSAGLAAGSGRRIKRRQIERSSAPPPRLIGERRKRKRLQRRPCAGASPRGSRPWPRLKGGLKHRGRSQQRKKPLEAPRRRRSASRCSSGATASTLFTGNNKIGSPTAGPRFRGARKEELGAGDGAEKVAARPIFFGRRRRRADVRPGGGSPRGWRSTPSMLSSLVHSQTEGPGAAEEGIATKLAVARRASGASRRVREAALSASGSAIRPAGGVAAARTLTNPYKPKPRVAPEVRYEPAAAYAGSRPSMVFKRGDRGVSYYEDPLAPRVLMPTEPTSEADAAGDGAAVLGGSRPSCDRTWMPRRRRPTTLRRRTSFCARSRTPTRRRAAHQARPSRGHRRAASRRARARVIADRRPRRGLRVRRITVLVSSGGAARDHRGPPLPRFDSAPLRTPPRTRRVRRRAARGDYRGKSEAFRSDLAAAEAELDEDLATARSSTSGALADGSDADDALAED